MRAHPFGLVCLGLIVACTNDAFSPGTPPGPAADLSCSALTEIMLAPGEATLLGANESAGCIRLPAGGDAREYLAVAYSAAGQTNLNGVTAPYHWRARVAGQSLDAPAAAYDRSPPDLDQTQEPGDAFERFHSMLRNRERALPPAPASVKPPLSVGARAQMAEVSAAVVGERHAFNVCEDAVCAAFASVPTTAVAVGRHLTLFVDDSLPAGGYTTADYQGFVDLFDRQLYGLDTMAFGRESDIDANGTVIAVMSRQINRLCPSVGGIVAGYFYGLDLRPEISGSNAGEIFYLVAPDPAGENGCIVTRDLVDRVLPGTLAHEFQHMISYNQHVLIRHGGVEDNWLNEGLSHLAEELAGRSLPASDCLAGDCVSQFTYSDVSNAYQYLLDPERWFAVYPSSSTGRGAERGAAWLFVRWMLDQYGAGAAFTRNLVQTDRIGADNVATATATPFATLLGQWHLANYLDGLAGFSSTNARLHYNSWDWRVTFPALRAQFPGQYPRAFPLAPDSTSGPYDRDGTLRGGSGRYLRVQVPARSEPIDLHLTDPGGAAPPASDIDARIAVVRVR